MDSYSYRSRNSIYYNSNLFSETIAKEFTSRNLSRLSLPLVEHKKATNQSAYMNEYENKTFEGANKNY